MSEPMDIVEFAKAILAPLELQAWQEDILRDIDAMTDEERKIWSDSFRHALGRAVVMRMDQ